MSNPAPHPCFGERAVIEFYDDDHGPGLIHVMDLSDGGTNHPGVLRGTRRTAKIHCFACGKTFLEVMTVPHSNP